MHFRLAAFLAPLFFLASGAHADCVLLVHGLARSSDSMFLMSQALKQRGHEVVLVDYPSTEADIETLAHAAIPPALEACGEQTVHAVGHSMGGILLRAWLRDNDAANLGRIVMMGTPNQGSELVDALDDVPLFHWLNGPAGAELSAGPNGIHRDLPAADFELGVIAGDRTFNPIYSSLVDGADDGKVAISSTRVEGMADHIVLHTTHTFMMVNPTVVAQVAHFLEEGRFRAPFGLMESLGYLDGREG